MSFVIEAARWYDSGIFWAGATVLVTLIVGIATIVVTFVVGFPKRRLLYGLWTTTPVGASGKSGTEDLQVSHRGVPLKAPQILEIILFTRGRKDIPSSAYDQGRPIRLDVGIPVLEVLGASSYPKSYETSKVTADGTALLIGPDLIRAGQRISIPILVDSREYRYRVKCQSTLIDVSVSAWKPRLTSSRKIVVYMLAAITAITFATFCLLEIVQSVIPAHSRIPEGARVWAILTEVFGAVTIVLLTRLGFIFFRNATIAGVRVPPSE
jgi:hypothetical protein